jgi:hypothetical protein
MELDDLVARTLAGVADGDRHLDGLALAQGAGGDPVGAQGLGAPMARGRPLTRTTTNGLPVAAIAVIRSSCAPGSVMSPCEPASPLRAEGAALARPDSPGLFSRGRLGVPTQPKPADAQPHKPCGRAETPVPGSGQREEQSQVRP